MKNPNFYQKLFYKLFTATVFIQLISIDALWAQLPTVLGTQTVNGTYATYNTVLRGGSRFVRLQATSSAAINTRNWEFCKGTDVAPDYSENWRPYGGSGNQPFAAYNQRLTPVLIFPTPTNQATANYNSGFGGTSGYMRAITAGNYYTFNIQNGSGNNNFAVLETSYNPKNITAASTPPIDVPILSPVTVTATLSGTLSSGEFLLIRYSTDGFATSSFVNMTLLSGTTYTGTIPGQPSGTTVQYYFMTSVTNTVGAAENQLNNNTADYLVLNLRNADGENVFGTNFSYTVGNLVVSAASGNWSSGATWVGGTPPTATQRARIESGHTVNLTTAASCAGLTISSGGTFNGGATTLTITRSSSDGCGLGVTTFDNQGTFNAGTGTIVFNNSGGANPVHRIQGTCTFNNVRVGNTGSGTVGLNFGSNSTVNGTFTIDAGGYVCTNAPFYGANSNLDINAGGTYTASAEWTTNATSGQGVPQNVIISNTTNYVFTGGDYRQCNGDIQISGGTTLTLSTSFGGDLKIGGNYTRVGTLVPNNRAIHFVGGRTQNINSTWTSGAYMVIDKTAGEVRPIGVDITIDGVAGGNSLTFLTANSKFNINGRIITIGSQISMAAGSAFKAGINSGSGAGTLVLQNGAGSPATAAMGTIFFRSDSAYLAQLTLNRPSAGGSVTFGNSVRAVNFTHTAGSFTVNSGATFRHNNNLTTPTSLYNIVVNGTWQGDGTINLASTASGASVLVSGNGAQFTTVGGLTISTGGTTAITVTSGTTSAATVNTGSSANFNAGSITLTTSGSNPKAQLISNGVSGAGTTVTLNDNEWTISGNNGWTGTFNVGTSTVIYNGTSAQNVRAAAYYNLSLINNNTKTPGGATSVTNDLSFTGGATLSMGVNNLNITGTGDRILGTGTITHGNGNITVAGNFSGSVNYSGTGTGSITVAGNWSSSGTVSATGASTNESIRVNGNFTGSGNITLGNGSAELFVDGNYSGTGSINFSVSGATIGLGGNITSTPTITNPANSRWYYYGNSPQNIYAIPGTPPITINRLRIKGAAGAHKTLPTNYALVVSDSFNCMSAINLIFPSNTSPQVTQLSFNNFANTGSGAITPDPTGRLTIGGSISFNTTNGSNRPILSFTTGTLGWLDVTRSPGADACVLEILTDLTLGRYNFPSGNGHIRVAPNRTITIAGTTYAGFGTNPTGVALLTGNNTGSASKYWALGTNANIAWTPNASIPVSTQCTFFVGFNPLAGSALNAATAVIGTGTFSSSTSSATITGTGTQFTQELCPGDLLIRSDNTVIGVVTATSFSATNITLAANATVNTTNGQFYVRRFYRPVAVIPQITAMGAGSQTITVGFRNHSGGPVTNGTNIAPSVSTRRSNYLIYAHSTSATQQFGLRNESTLAFDYNNSVSLGLLAFYRTTGTNIWEKYRVNGGFGSTGIGGVANNFIERSNAGTLNSDNLFALGQTGGDLGDDPSFTWVGTTSSWTTPANWVVSGTPALYPNSPAHNITIGAAGTANPVLPAGVTSVGNIFHTDKTLTVPGGATFSIFGQYSLNFPGSPLLQAGTGTINTSRTTVVTVNGIGTNFLSELQPGSYLYRSDNNMLIGIVQNINSNTQLELMTFGLAATAGVVGIENITDDATFNYITPAATPLTGTLTATSGSLNISLSGGSFTSAMVGRVLLDNTGALIGVISHIVDANNAVLTRGSYVSYTGSAAQIRNGIPGTGPATLVCQDNSHVIYGANFTQMVAPANYFDVTFADGRSLATPASSVWRLVFATNRTITIRGTMYGRYHCMHANITGTVYQFLNNSKLDLLVPGYTSGDSPGAGQLWRAYAPFNPHPNVRYGNVATDRVDMRFEYNRNTDLTFQGPEFALMSGGRLRDLEYVRNGNNTFIINSGNTIIVNGTLTMTNNGTGGQMMRFGNGGSPVNLIFRGPMNFGGSNPVNYFQTTSIPSNLHNVTIEGTGAITPASIDIFAHWVPSDGYSSGGTTPMLNNFTLNRPGVTINLNNTSNARHFVVANTLTVSNGTLSRLEGGNVSANTLNVNGNGSIVYNSSCTLCGLYGGTGHINVSGNGNITVTGQGIFGVPNPIIGDINLSGNGVIDLSGGTNTTGYGANGNITINGGTFTGPTAATAPVRLTGNFTINGGTFTKAAGVLGLGALGVGGNLAYNGGTLNTSNLTLNIEGSTTQSYSSTTNKNAIFSNITINKTGGSFDINSGKITLLNTLTFATGTTLNTTTAGNLTFASSASGTARVAALPAGATMSGSNYTVERYVNTSEATPAQGWYFFGTPITGTTFSQLNDNFSVRIPVSCTGLTFSPSSPSISNVMFHDESGLPAAPDPINKPQEVNGWRFPTTCDLFAGRGYRLFLNSSFFTGNRKLDVTGALLKTNNSAHNYGVTYTPGAYGGGGWNFVANPYPSNINWDAAGWTRTNVDNAYYIWNGTTAQYGSYVAGIGTPAAWMNGIIASGQAFFVKANAASPVLTSSESVKTATSKSFIRVAELSNLMRLRVHGNGQVADEAVVYFNQDASDAFEGTHDAYKMQNPGLNISSLSIDGRDLSINGLGMLNATKEVPLVVTAPSHGMYYLDVFQILNFDPAYSIYLKDAYTNTITPITNEAFSYAFFVTPDINSQGGDRFSLVFSNDQVITGNVNNMTSALNVAMYPNPNNGREVHFTLSGKVGDMAHITITDALGRVVLQRSAAVINQAFKLDTQLAAGVYTVVVETNKNKVAKKLVVK